MGELEKRFFSRKHETTVKSDSELAIVIDKVLKKAITTGNFILRGGQSSKFNFRFDSIYDFSIKK